MSIAVETARDILLDAFDDMVAHIEDATLTSADALTGIKAINRIMATLDANGVSVGFTKLEQISDPVTIPEGLMDALVSMLALRLWPKYRTVEPTAAIVMAAKEGERQMYLTGIEMAATEYPSTLPMGSGNVWYDGFSGYFYPDLQSTILDETGGSIGLEDDTE